MDSDEDLRAAMESGCVFGLFRVLGVAREKTGTRSQVAAYDGELVRMIDGASAALTRLMHFGPPRMEVGQVCVVGALDSGRHHGAWELRFAAATTEAPEAAIAAFLSRRAALPP